MSIRRAFISAYDKTDLAEFARHLQGMGVELVVDEGTGSFLRDEGIETQLVGAGRAMR